MDNFTTDFYLNSNNAYKRLEDEYLKYGKLIIACDYDDTLYDFHKKGRTYNDVINLLQRWKDYAEIIIWTGNGEEKYDDITKYLEENDIPFNGINCDSNVKVNGRKIYANVYLDDRAGLQEVYGMLEYLITMIEMGEIIYV